MTADDSTLFGLEVALNEAEVAGLRVDPQTGACDVLVTVMSLPSTGPVDPDGRRILRLHGPTEILVVLRRLVTDPGPPQPPIPLPDLAAVEDLFASLTWADTMYGWDFFDHPELTRDWPSEPSLTLRSETDPASHTFFWFTECGRDEGGLHRRYVLEGTVVFDDVTVLRADGTVIPLDDVIADGRRAWDAFYARDARMSVDAQRAAQDARVGWRGRPPAGGTIVPGP